jgi:dolichyl-diphosphooligosaccharide--protein glycosyltransferase
MMLAKSTVINLQRPWFDPMTFFPHGTSIHFGPFVSWSIASVSLLTGLGHPSTHTIEVIGAFFPAVLGALLVVPVYFIGREIGGRACGFVSALIITVLPGQLFSRTTLGFTDHHSAEAFLSALTMIFFVMALSRGRNMTFRGLRKDWSSMKRPLLFSVLAGVSLGLYIDAWSSGFLFEGIMLIFVLVQSIIDHIKGRNVEYLATSSAIAFLLAILMVLPFVKPENGFNRYIYSPFHPTILLLGAAFVILLALLSRFIRDRGLSRYYYPGVVVGVLLLGFLLLAVAVPQFTGAFFGGLSIFQPKTGGAATVAEASSILYPQGQFSLDGIQANFPGFLVILSPFFLSLVAMALLILRNLREQRPADIQIIVWSLITLFLTLAQNRFAYYYAINVALLSGYLAFRVLELAGFEEIESKFSQAQGTARFLGENIKVVVAALAIFFLLIYPGLSYSVLTARSVSGPDQDWLTSTAWLYNSTPSPGMDIYKIYQRPQKGQFPYPDAAYGIMSWWDYGHMIETVGHRIPNSNPFQQGIGSKTSGVSGSSPFFLAESEEEAEEVLAGLDRSRSPYMNTKYVMTDWDMATGKFYAMTAWSNIPITRYYGFFYQQLGERLEPMSAYRDPFFKTMVSRLHYFDGTETPVGEAFAIAYETKEYQGMTLSVITEPPLISKDYKELQDYLNESRSKGFRAEIISRRDPTSLSPSVPLEALKHYRLVHESESVVTYDGQKFVKTFEHVPGAVIKGSAPAGTKVSIEVPVLTNRQRLFVYRQSGVSNGEFTLVVPYSTEGPITGGTNFDTAPIGPYLLTVGDKKGTVNVPEEAVLSGEVIRA